MMWKLLNKSDMKNYIFNNPKNTAGFTLVEILVALAILSISLSAVLYAINQNTSNLVYLRDKTFAHWVALNKAAEFRINPGLIRNSRSLTGRYTLAARDWNWTAQVKNTEDNDLKRIEIAVYSAEDVDFKLSSLTAFITFRLLDK